MGRPKLTGAVLVVLLAALGPAPSLQAQEKSLPDQARADAAAGRYARAAQLYREVLQSQPDNPDALGGLADALEASGHWWDAVAPLSRLVELQPRNAARLFQLGQMRSWQKGGRAQALDLLKRPTELDPQNADFAVAYAEVLSWSAADRPEAARILRGVIAAHPDHVEARRLWARVLARQHERDPAMAVLEPLTRRPNAEAEDFWTLGQVEEASGNMQAATAAYRQAFERNPSHLVSLVRLAQILSWYEATRPEAAQLFERGLQLDPHNVTLLLGYAEMLSWKPATRAQAMIDYDRVLAQDPSSASALAGKAQLLAWSARSAEAMALYDKALSLDPANLAALRGKAEILNWRGRNAEALSLLEHAHNLAPGDSATLVEMARANYELRHYTAARAELAQVPSPTAPEMQVLRRDVNRALGTYLELGYSLRRNKRRLDDHRLEAVISAPLGASNRLSVFYRPTLYQTRQGDFNSNYYALSLDSQPSEALTTHAWVASETYPGVTPAVDGAFDVRYRVRPSFELQMGFERELVEESRVSTRGTEADGIFVGRVHSNLGSIGASYSSTAHHYDLSLTYSDGIYTGHNIASNRRWSLDGNAGYSVHSYQPYLRIGYGVTYLSFDHDADFQPGEASPRVTGGYFSPTRYLLNYGSIFLSHELRRQVKWDAGGTLGAQNAETSTQPFANTQFASTFSTHLTWNINDHNDVRIGYNFLNVFNAFRRNLFQVTWRHYF